MTGPGGHGAGVTRRGVLKGGAALAFAGLVPRAARTQAVDGHGPLVLTAREGRAQLLEDGGPDTAIWGYDGIVPGPPIRVRQGDRVTVRLRNEVPQGTTIHWHGIRIDNAMDGVAGLTQDAVAPGDSFDYSFVVPDAGTYWYHPHNRSWEQLARGLYGALIVEERAPPDVDQDLLVVADDWRLDDSGRIDEASFGAMRDWSHAGRLGNVLTLNGQPFADLPVRSGERLRLRLCNTANARVLQFRFEDIAPVVVALDGQPVPPQALDDGRVTLAPAQRADLMIDMTGSPGSRAAITEVSGDGRLVAGHFVYHGAETVPARRGEIPPLPANPLDGDLDLADARRVELLMAGGAMGGMAGAMHDGEYKPIRDLVKDGMVWAFNGVAGRTDRPFFAARPGETVVVRMVNDSRWPHAMHVHGHHVKELARAGGNSTASGDWRDSVLLDRDETVTVGFKADNPGKWMLHCHMLEHQAAGMATWFRVGDRA